MLVSIRISDNSTVFAKHAKKDDAPFVCPDCKALVVLRQGLLTVPHFAHQIERVCESSSGETELHRRVKAELFECLIRQPNVTEVTLERRFGTVRADVFALVKRVPVAIEVQVSNLSQEAIAFRTTEYHKRGIFVLWLLPWTKELDDYRYSPRAFERWLHATYFGRLYFWRTGLEVIPYQFRDKHHHVARVTWKDRRGRTNRAGGYQRVSKRFKIAVRGKPLHLVDDFGPATREPWQSYELQVPRANLYLDKRRNFELD